MSILLAYDLRVHGVRSAVQQSNPRAVVIQAIIWLRYISFHLSLFLFLILVLVYSRLGLLFSSYSLDLASSITRLVYCVYGHEHDLDLRVTGPTGEDMKIIGKTKIDIEIVAIGFQIECVGAEGLTPDLHLVMIF